MKKTYLLFFLLCSLAITLCVKIVGHSQKAEKLNDEQVQNILTSAEQLVFPEDIECQQIQVFHIQAADTIWSTYVFVFVESSLSYDEMVSFVEQSALQLQDGATPFKVITYSTYLEYAKKKDYFSDTYKENEAAQFVLVSYAPVKDSFDLGLKQELVASVRPNA